MIERNDMTFSPVDNITDMTLAIYSVVWGIAWWMILRGKSELKRWAITANLALVFSICQHIYRRCRTVGSPTGERRKRHAATLVFGLITSKLQFGDRCKFCLVQLRIWLSVRFSHPFFNGRADIYGAV